MACTNFWVGLALAVTAGLVWWFWEPIWQMSVYITELAMDKELMRQRMDSFGVWAPVVFVGFQIFQVLISPVPGELVGAVGGLCLRLVAGPGLQHGGACRWARGSISSWPASWASGWWKG